MPETTLPLPATHASTNSMKRYLKYILLMALPVSLFGLNDTSLFIYYYGKIGSNNTNSGTPSLNVGSNHITSSQNSASMGSSLQNYQQNNLTVGQYNSPVAGELFTVGNGQYATSGTTRSNSLSVSDSGTVNIPGTVFITSIPAQGGIANFTGTAPVWWSTPPYTIFSTQTQEGNDNSPVNIGQLKHVASRARMYFDARFSAAGGAGTQIYSVTTFSNSDNFAPVAVGQLKNVVKAFYDCLNSRGYDLQTPWAGGTVDLGNAAPATIGQLKRAFSFDLGFATTDTDGDGLTDWAEYDGAGNPSQFDLPKLTLQYAWREANGRDRLDGQGSGTYRAVTGEATGNSSRGWIMNPPPLPGETVSAPSVLTRIIHEITEFPFSDWTPWPGSVNARFYQSRAANPMPVVTHTFQRREIKVRLYADRPMPVAWKVHLTKMRSAKLGPVEETWDTQTVDPVPVVLQIPMGGQEAVYTLSPESADPGPPTTQFPNVEAVVEYQLVSTGTSVPPVTTEGAEKDTDGDGVPDAIELKLGTDPLVPSSSGNGIKDGDFQVEGISSPGTHLVGHSRSLRYDYTASNGGRTHFTTNWGEEPPSTTTVYEAFPPLNTPLIGKAFPAGPPIGPLGYFSITTLLKSSPPGDPKLDAIGKSNPSKIVNGVACRHAELQHHRLWAVLFPASTVPTSRTFLKLITRVINGEEVVSATSVVFSFEANNPISNAYSDLLPEFSSTDGPETVKFTLVPMEFNVDVDEDSQIASGEIATELKTFETWINDDDDLQSSGPPQQKDYISPQVNGQKDLEDFSPVFLNIEKVVAALPPSASVKYKLKQADGALNFCETSMLRTEAFTRGGTSLTSAPTQQVTAAGVELSTTFLNNIRDHNKGVILVEGRKPSIAPLILVLEQDGVSVAEVPLHTTIAARIQLMLHGMNSNTATWDAIAKPPYASDIVNRVIQGTTAPLMSSRGVRIYRLQFGYYDPGSTRVGLEQVTAAGTSGYLADMATKRCGDFETFAELGQEVNDVISLLLNPVTHPEHQYAKIVLVGHSRGGIAARAFLQGSSSLRSSVVGLVTTGSPHQGSPMGRIYNWLDLHKRNAAGTDEDDWEVVDQLLKNGLDVRRPVIGDLAVLTTFNSTVSNLPASLRCAELVYQHENLGRLARLPAGLGIYTVFDEPGTNPGDNLSTDAETDILGAGHTSTSFVGDGLIPGPMQRFTTFPSFGAVTVAPLINTTASVLHTEEPFQVADLRSQLKATISKWIAPRRRPRP